MASLFHCPGVACEEMCDKSLPNSLVLLELELMFILRCLDGPYAAPLRHSSSGVVLFPSVPLSFSPLALWRMLEWHNKLKKFKGCYFKDAVHCRLKVKPSPNSASDSPQTFAVF